MAVRLLRAKTFSLLLLFGLTTPAFSTKIEYETLNLVDTQPNQDLWEYKYFVSGRTFAVNQGFTIFFNFNLFGELQGSPPAPSPDWHVITLQPDLQIPDNGAYDALALADNASLLSAFAVDFVFLGSGTPGSQPFTINQFDAAGNLIDTLETGTTVPRQTTVVPEPHAWTLVICALIGISAGRGTTRFPGQRRP